MPLQLFNILWNTRNTNKKHLNLKKGNFKPRINAIPSLEYKYKKCQLFILVAHIWQNTWENLRYKKSLK